MNPLASLQIVSAAREVAGISKSVRNRLKRDEGFRGDPYDDHLGNPTIGYGSLLPLSEREAEVVMNMRVTEHREGLAKALAKRGIAFVRLPQPAQDTLTQMAFQLGAMGSATRNFYNDAFRRAGWEEEARAVQRLWRERRRAEAAAAVPDDLILRSSLIGPAAAVRERIRLYREAGVTTLRLSPIGATPADRIEQLGQALDLVTG